MSALLTVIVALASVARSAELEGLPGDPQADDGFAGRRAARELTGRFGAAAFRALLHLGDPGASPAVLAALDATEKAERALLADPATFQAQQGMVTSWWLVGPFPDPDGTGLDRAFFPETEIDRTRRHVVDGRKYRWRQYNSNSITGVIDLLSRFRRTEKVLAYGYHELASTRARDVKLWFGSDEGMVCWLNGERIYTHRGPRAPTAGEDVVRARLRAGTSTLLVKVNNTAGRWTFTLRLTDLDDRPIDLWKLYE